jgi:hypothetical protein
VRLALLLCILLALPARAIASLCPPTEAIPKTAQPSPPQPGPGGKSLPTEIAAAAAAERYATIGFGDSIMFGWPKDLLTDASGGTALNAAVGGGTQTVLWELMALDWSRQAPRSVVLLVGTNNLGIDGCEVFWGIRADVAAIRNTFRNSRIIVVGILPRGENLRDREKEIELANAALREGAVSGSYTLVDAHDAFLCNHQTPCDLFDRTNLHLTRRGYQVLTDRLRAALEAAPSKPN